MNKFILNITASSGEFYQGYCEDLTLPTGDGVYGVQAGHSPVLVALHMGMLHFAVDGESRDILVGDGIAEVTPAYVMVLVDSAERPGGHRQEPRRGSPHPRRGAPAAQAEHARVLPEQDRSQPCHAAPADFGKVPPLSSKMTKHPISRSFSGETGFFCVCV